MKIIKIILCAFIFTAINCNQSITLPWNIVIYMEASAGHLYQAAFKNIDEIARNTPENAHVFVFLHTQGNIGWLYHVTKNNIHKITNITCNSSVAQTLINVMTVAIEQGPAQRYGLVLWNHGYGILDPMYDAQNNDWYVPYDGPYEVGCSIKRSPNIHRLYHRGMCINDQHTFLSNTEMTYAFDIICNQLLNGQKLSFCGMDLCKGAMFEHAYQLSNYVEYLIGSQECEMVDGWPYDMVFQIINDIPHAPTREITMHIVNAFNHYYEKFTEQNTYTLSALDLHYAQQLKHNIDSVSDMLIVIMKQSDHVKKIVKQLRTQCKAFCDAPMYCDLYQWYSVLLDAFNQCNGIDQQSDIYHTFRQLLVDGLELMSTMTVARCTGSASTHAHGSSIYFPQFAINPSYETSSFAQESTWVQFLQQFLA
jgi:Clostripain family